MDFLALPSDVHWTIKNANVVENGPDGQVIVNTREISFQNGFLTDQPSPVSIDAQKGLLLPLFVDMHTHLDKGHIWPRASNPDGTFFGALNTVAQDRTQRWKTKDVQARMNFALQCAYAHGTGAIRTHLDSKSPQHRISWPLFAEMRQEWQGRIELQAVTILGIEDVDRTTFLDIANLAAQSGGILGCVSYPSDDIESRLRCFFEIAREREMHVDFHTDETHETASNTLEIIAKLVIDMGFEFPVNVGHCCAISQQDDETIDRTLDLVAKAGLSVVSLPMCNMYLQDRNRDRTPRWRGITLVHEMARRGIPVSFASDNTRDPFYAYGDLDMIEVLREATRICHLDHSEFPWLNSFSKTPAEVCGFKDYNLASGQSADFILFKARNLNELMSRPQMDRVVVRKGMQIDRTLPDYSELDYLTEVT